MSSILISLKRMGSCLVPASTLGSSLQKKKRSKPMNVAGTMIAAISVVQPAALVAMRAIRMGNAIDITMEPAIVIMPP